jgi:surfeit locus 1 family protein
MSSRIRFGLPALLVVVALVCARLGVWQLHRLHERRAANAAALAARREPVVDLAASSLPRTLANRRVRGSGRYDRGHEIVLRGVTFEEAPGVQVVTPLVLASGAAVLVKRGFVPAPDAVTADLAGLDETGVVTISGLALPIDSSRRRGVPLTRDGQTTWARLDLPALREALPYPLLPVYVLQAPDPALPRSPRRLQVPALDDGPHLSYALQWFAFATTALIVAGILAFRSPERSPVHPADR